jgi:hypothetical protein
LGIIAHPDQSRFLWEPIHRRKANGAVKLHRIAAEAAPTQSIAGVAGSFRKHRRRSRLPQEASAYPAMARRLRRRMMR